MSIPLVLGVGIAGWLVLPLALARLLRRFLPSSSPRVRGHRRGPRARRGTVLSRIAEGLRAASAWRPRALPRLRIGHARLPRRLEPYHLLVTGSPGSGKSTLVEGLLLTLRRRGERAVVFDVGGECGAVFPRPDDLLLDPLDVRGVPWSPFAEMRGADDAPRIARALVPAGHGEGQEWHHYAQTLLAAVLARLWERGEATNGRLLDVLLRAPDGELRALVAGTAAERLLAPGAERMTASVRAILGSYLPALETLDPAAGADGFGCRGWVTREDDRGWLFLALRDSTAALVLPLVTAWIDLLVSAVLSLAPDPARRVWLVLDECDSLGAVPGLLPALTKGRKYGLCVVAGLQSVAQLERRYGPEGARVLLACFATKVFLRSSDAETARYAARQLGEREVFLEEGLPGPRKRRPARRLHRESLVLPGEIATLRDRRGWLQRPGPVPVVRVRIPRVRREPGGRPAFVSRAEAASPPAHSVRPAPFPSSSEEDSACSV